MQELLFSRSECLPLCIIWNAVLQVPKQKISLGLLPTPLHPFKPPNIPDNVEMFIKRKKYAPSLPSCQARYLHAGGGANVPYRTAQGMI